MSKIRYSNFELLRILAMLLIVTHHYSIHGDWYFESGVSFNKLYIQSLSIGGKVGVNLFVLISAFFLSKQNNLNIKDSVIKIITPVYFYSLTIACILFFFKDISIKEIIKSLIPVGYWFVNAFLLMVIFSPFINIIVENIQQKTHLIIITISTIILNIPILNIEIGNFGFFVYLYFISAYIRKYLADFKFNNLLLNLIIILSVSAVFISILLLDYLSLKNISFNHPLYFIKERSIFIIIISISLFILFKQMKITKSEFINLLASTTFGIYLIHDNYLIRSFIWNDLLKVTQYFNSNLIYIMSILSILLVFFICSLIELLRRFLFKLICVSLNFNKNKLSI